MADEVLQLVKDLRAPTPGRLSRQFTPGELSSLWTSLFGPKAGEAFSKEDLKKLSKLFVENPEDVKKLQSLIKKTTANRPSTDLVALFDNEALDLEMPEKGVIKGQTRWTSARGKRPAEQIFRRVGFKDTPFIDIDFPSPVHSPGAVTASGLKAGLTDLLRYQRDFRKKGFNPTGPVYLTPAGMHYIEEGFKMNPRDFNRLGSPSDPFYRMFSERPLLVEGAKNPTGFRRNVSGIKGAKAEQIFDLLESERPEILNKRKVLGVLPPMFNARTGPKYRSTGNFRVEDSPRGRIGDFVKAKIGRLGEGTPLDSSLRASRIHDEDILEALEDINKKYPKAGKSAMDISRTRALEEVKDLPKDLKRKLGITPASLAKAAKGGIPLLLLSLLLPMLLDGRSQDQAA